jgi:uncharacterized protein (TIGR02271 family)
MEKKKFFGLFEDDKDKDTEIAEDGKLFLREEELDIAKDRVSTGEVNLHKEIIEERKVMDVPVAHEEVIIERKAFNHEHSDTPIGSEESIHIPVSEERLQVGKHTELVGEISAHKREVEEPQHVDEVLKREEARVDVDGHPRVISDKDKHRRR